jgi:hypothetical protein
MHIGLEDAPYLSIQSSEEKTGPEMSSQGLIELSTISHGCTLSRAEFQLTARKRRGKPKKPLSRTDVLSSQYNPRKPTHNVRKNRKDAKEFRS